MNGWMVYVIRREDHFERGFYAPDLATAFALARARWPFSKMLRWMGVR